MENEIIELSDGYSVSKKVYECFRQMVDESLPRIYPGIAYTIKKILGKDIWDELDTGERIEAGKCIALAVARGDLPLCFAGKTSSNHSLYKLK